MILTHLYAYVAVLLAILFLLGVFQWRRSGDKQAGFRGFKSGSVDDAFNRWLIEGINSGRVDLSDLVSTDEEITIGGIRFKGEIKIQEHSGEGGNTDSTRPIVRLRNKRLEEV